MDFFPNLTWLKRKCCIIGCDISDGSHGSRQAGGLLDENGAASLSILRTNDLSLTIMSHPSVSALRAQQQERSWQDGWQPRQSTKITKQAFQNLTTFLNIWQWTKSLQNSREGQFSNSKSRNKRKRFDTKIYKQCDSTGYTYDTDVCLGKDRRQMTQHLTATHDTVTNMARRVEGYGYKLHEQFLFFLWPIWWFGPENDLLFRDWDHIEWAWPRIWKPWYRGWNGVTFK